MIDNAKNNNLLPFILRALKKEQKFINMATGYTREWIQFFTGCGIPDDVAAMYALIFYENRIQKNMLLDLNKEYLRDMGITVMGDVIAILRHAKIIHEKYLRAQILSIEDSLIIEKNNSASESSPAVKKTTPMKRILEHYTRKYNSCDSEPLGQMQLIFPNEKLSAFSNKRAEKIGTQRPLKKKIQISSTDKEIQAKGLEVPVPKVRRVLPENEGTYKIKMPSGTTERSKKLLEQVRKQKAKTVFDRLGESSVSSTTSDISTISSASMTPLNREKNPSVFSRLGEKTSVVSSTSADDFETLPQHGLPYAGILKPLAHKKNLSNTTMRADEQQQSEVNGVKKVVSVKKRLGITKVGQAPSQKKTMLKAIRRIAGEGQAKTTVITSKKYDSTQPEGRSDASTVLTKKIKIDSMQSKANITTATQTQKIKLINLKRKIDSDSADVSPLKKVRFGKTTHRLIPSSPNPAGPVSYVKNYPKLTMIIKNTEVTAENKLSSGIKIGSLNSDNLKSRIGVKARIGSKFQQGRLGKQPPVQSGAQGRKTATIKDRLG